MNILLCIGQVLFSLPVLSTATYSANTGDQFAIWIVVGVVVVAAVLLLALSLLKKKKKK